MRMLAADAANRRRHFSDRLFKPLRQMQHLSSAVIEDGSQLSPERAVFFLPEIEGENTIPSTKERRRSNLRAIAAWHVRQSVERNRQLACPSRCAASPRAPGSPQGRSHDGHSRQSSRATATTAMDLLQAKRKRTPCPCRRPRRRTPRRAAHTVWPGAGVPVRFRGCNRCLASGAP